MFSISVRGLLVLHDDITLQKDISNKLLSCIYSLTLKGWSGGAMVLGKLPVPGRPTNLD